MDDQNSNMRELLTVKMKIRWAVVGCFCAIATAGVYAFDITTIIDSVEQALTPIQTFEADARVFSYG